MAALTESRKALVSDDGLLSVRDWLAIGETKPHYELINGQLVQKQMKTYRQCKAVGSFLTACISQCEIYGWQFFLGGTGVYVSERIGYVPDVVGFAPGNEVDPEAAIEGAPTLVVEVLSPGTATKDRTDKKRNYARIGVRIYILIDPTQKTMEVFRLNGTRYRTPETLRENDVWTPAELPELELQLSKLWM